MNNKVRICKKIMFDRLKSVAGPFFVPSMFICFSFPFPY